MCCLARAWHPMLRPWCRGRDPRAPRALSASARKTRARLVREHPERVEILAALAIWRAKIDTSAEDRREELTFHNALRQLARVLDQPTGTWAPIQPVALVGRSARGRLPLPKVVDKHFDDDARAGGTTPSTCPSNTTVPVGGVLRGVIRSRSPAETFSKTLVCGS